MKIAHYEQMMDYLTGPRESFRNGGRTGFAKAGFVFGDQKFNVDIPNMTPVQSKSFQKGLKNLEKWLENPNAENWIKTFRTPSAKGQTHQSDFSLNLRKYLQGQPVNTRTKELFDSVNIKNLLGNTVKDIQTYTPQEFRRVTNLPKSKKAAEVAMAKSAKAANAVRDVFVKDPDADLEDVARGIFGKDFDNASVVVQEDMLSKASDDTAKLLEALSANRPVPGFKPIAADKMGDIIQNIEDNTKDFKFSEGTIREYRFRVRDSLLGLKTESEQGFRNLRNVVGGTDKGKVVDEVFGLSATFKNAPGYVENVQLIDKKINNIKGKQIDKPFSAIVNAVKNKKDIVQYEGKETNISEAIKKFNAKSKLFSNVNKISTPQIFVGDDLDATKLVSNFDKYSSAAQKDILKNAKEGFVLNATKPSTPAGFFLEGRQVPMSLGATGDIEMAKNIIKKDAATTKNFLSKGFTGLDRFLLRPLTAIEAPTLAIPQSAAAAYKLAGDVKRGEQTDVGAMDITLPTSLSSLAASKKFGLDLFADNAGRVKRFLRGPFTQQGIRTLSRGSVFAAPVIETAIQGYNARQRLLKAREQYGTDDMVPTGLGMAPREYVRDLAIENQKFEGEGLSPFQAAGGGIAKLAGKSSGPPPESGPLPQGLDFLIKRGRQS